VLPESLVDMPSRRLISQLYIDFLGQVFRGCQ